MSLPARLDADVRYPGQHPAFGGYNWGVQPSEHWGDFNVNHGYTGMHEDTPDGHKVDGSPVPSDLPLWSCDQAVEADARAVWSERETLNAALRAAGLVGYRHSLRLRIVVEADRFVVTNYDYSDAFAPLVVAR